MVLYSLFYCFGIIALFFLMLLVRKIFNKEGFLSFLIRFTPKGFYDFGKGMLIGLAGIAVYFVYILFLKKGEFVFTPGALIDTLVYTGLILFYTVCVAFFEEGLYRGYALIVIKRKTNALVAVLITSAIFSAYHILVYINSPHMALGLINAFIVGCALAVTVLRKNTLMIAVGFHFIYNFGLMMLSPVEDYKLKTLFHLRIFDSRGYDATTEPVFTAVFVLFLLYALMMKKEDRAI